MTVLTDIGAVSGFSTVCVAGGRAVFSCFGGSGMTGFTSGGVGTGDVLGVTLDATGNGGSGCAGAGFGGSGGLTGLEVFILQNIAHRLVVQLAALFRIAQALYPFDRWLEVNSH